MNRSLRCAALRSVTCAPEGGSEELIPPLSRGLSSTLEWCTLLYSALQQWGSSGSIVSSVSVLYGSVAVGCAQPPAARTLSRRRHWRPADAVVDMDVEWRASDSHEGVFRSLSAHSFACVIHSPFCNALKTPVNGPSLSQSHTAWLTYIHHYTRRATRNETNLR